LRLANARRLRRALRCARRRRAEGRWHGARRQDQHGRVRDGLFERDVVLRAGEKSVEPRRRSRRKGSSAAAVAHAGPGATGTDTGGRSSRLAVGDAAQARTAAARTTTSVASRRPRHARRPRSGGLRAVVVGDGRPRPARPTPPTGCARIARAPRSAHETARRIAGIAARDIPGTTASATKCARSSAQLRNSSRWAPPPSSFHCRR
jgi:hypothetical protein